MNSVLEANPQEPQKLSDPKKVVIAWSKDDHPPNTHGYHLFAKTYGALLSKIDGMEATAVEGFPSADLWQDADLVIFYLTIKELNDAQYELLDAHLAKGKALMVLHQGIVQRQRTGDWADRIGYSFGWEGESRSKWGAWSAPVVFDVSHPIFAGFPASVPYRDELYWRLNKGTRGTVTDIATTTAPANKEDSDEPWPVYWTVEHEAVGGAPQARVFGCVIGHYDEYLEQQIFMTTLCRATAWCVYETFEPFKAPLRQIK
ncbi:MAG: ThuA domain-containing protein [Verrucomicrobiota bacterium]